MQTLEVVLALVVYFLLMSMIASATVDLLESRVRKKARNLLTAVRTACGGGPSLAEAIYRHPRIDVLYEAGDPDASPESENKGTLGALWTPGNASRGLPSYIPEEAFARAFIETLLAGKLEEFCNLGSLFSDERRRWQHPAEGATAPALTSADLDDGYEVLRPFVLEARGDPDRCLSLVAANFKKVNERATGWYKRWVAKCLLWLGFVLALATNGDALGIIHRLTADPVLRGALVQLGESYKQEDLRSFEDRVPPAANVSKEDRTDTLSKTREQVLSDLRTAEGVSGGWSKDPLLSFAFSELSWWGLLLLKIIGLGITAIAISLGAPFWFNLLQSLLKLRSLLTGKNTEPKDEEQQARAATEARESIQQKASASDLQSSTLDTPELRRMQGFARYAELAYLPLQGLEEALGMESNRRIHFISGTGRRDRGDGTPVPVDTQVYVLESDKQLIITFRGTEPKVPADLVTDARFKSVTAPWLADPSIRIHGGFLAALDAVWEELSLFWKRSADAKDALPARQITFCGHSLGGALAVLAAARFLAENPAQAERLGGVYTIGQPRVGNQAFASWASPRFAGRYIRAVNNRDAVPRLPFAALDFSHFGTVHFFDGTGRLWIDPSWFFRLLDYTLPDGDLKGSASTEWIRTMKEAGTDHSASNYVGLYKRLLPV